MNEKNEKLFNINRKLENTKWAKFIKEKYADHERITQEKEKYVINEKETTLDNSIEAQKLLQSYEQLKNTLIKEMSAMSGGNVEGVIVNQLPSNNKKKKVIKEEKIKTTKEVKTPIVTETKKVEVDAEPIEKIVETNTEPIEKEAETKEEPIEKIEKVVEIKEKPIQKYNTLYISLHSEPYSHLGNQQEITGAAYERQKIDCGETSGWNFSSENCESKNPTTITWPVAKSDWGEIFSVGLWTDPLSGNMIYGGDLTPPKTVQYSNIFQIASGNLLIITKMDN